MAQFLTNCTTLSLAQLKNKNLAISISAMVCFLLTAAILSLLVFCRVYKTTLQRFFQYLTTVTLLHLFFIAMDIQLQSNFSHGPELCKFLGFIRQWTATMTYFFVLVITVYLIYKVYCQLNDSPSTTLSKHKSSYYKLLEGGVVTSVVLLPLTFLWVPFYHDTYGIYATSCWIQKVDIHCNKSIGRIDQIAMVSVLRIVMIIVIISFLILSVLFCRFACHYRETRRAHLKTIRQTFLLMCFFVVSSLIEITGLLMYVYTAISGKDVDNYAFWLVYDIAMPFSQLIIPFGFLVYLYSFRWKAVKLASVKWRTTCRLCFMTCLACTRCKTRRGSSSDSQKQDLLSSKDTDAATAPISNRISAPSETYFSVGYTGAFTNITVTDTVISTAADTGYGSVADT